MVHFPQILVWLEHNNGDQTLTHPLCVNQRTLCRQGRLTPCHASTLALQHEENLGKSLLRRKGSETRGAVEGGNGSYGRKMRLTFLNPSLKGDLVAWAALPVQLSAGQWRRRGEPSDDPLTPGKQLPSSKPPGLPDNPGSGQECRSTTY
jgi:hypothetical protein